MKKILYFISFPINCLLLLIGLIYYKIIGKTPAFSYRSMLRLFYVTGGLSNDVISFLVKKKNSSKLITSQSDVKSKQIASFINQQGFYLYRDFLNPQEISEILQIVKNNKFKLRKTDDQLKDLNLKNEDNFAFFDEKNIKSVIYEADMNFLINQDVIQSILLKSEIWNIARNYFNSEPFLDHISLGVATSFNKNKNTGDSEAAQLFHFDMDKPKWLKFLIYVNDVDLSNGPHSFVKFSHRNFGIPFKFRSRGYVRLNDEELFSSNLQPSVITGKAGTAIIEDTRGLHKGTKLISGHRILLNIQVNNSMFGSSFQKYIFKNIDEKRINDFVKIKDVFCESTNLNEYLNKALI